MFFNNLKTKKMKKNEKKFQQNHQDDFVDEFLNNGDVDNNTLLTVLKTRWLEEDKCEKAAIKMLNQKPNNYQLTQIIRLISSSKIKTQAALMLLENNPSNEQLIYIIEWVDDPNIREEAAQKIFEQNPTKDYLRSIIINVREFADRAGWMIYNQNPDLSDLSFLIGWTKSSYLKIVSACELLEEREELPIKTIQLILARVPELAKKAWLIYLKNNPTQAELEWVVKNVKDPQIIKEAEDLLRLVD